jgi:hypothetical protein
VINPPTITRRRITVTLARGIGPTAARTPRTVNCLSPSYSAAIAAVLAAGPRHGSVRILAVGEADARGCIRLRRRWPYGIDPTTARLAGLAAAGLAALMAGATIINATVLHNTTYGVNVWMTALLCAVFVLLAYGRRQQIKSLAAAIRR